MSLRTRLLGAFGLVTGVMLVPSLFAASRLSSLRDIAIEGRKAHAAAVTSLGGMQRLVTELDRLERSFVATGDSALGSTAAARLDSLQRVYGTFRTSPYGDLASELEPILLDIDSLSADLDRRVRNGRLADATDEFDVLLSSFSMAERQFQSMADSIDTRAGSELATAEAMTRLARTRTLLGVGLALGLALLFTSLTTHALSAPLTRLGRAMAAVADGVLKAPEDLPFDRDDEIGDLATSFDIMTRRLATLDRRKSEFLGLVSHELKTPINVIRAYAEILRDELPELPECQKRLIEDVVEQTDGMAHRVSRLMDLSRLEAGTYQLQFDSVRLDRFMADVVATFRRPAEQKGIKLVTTVSTTVPDEVVMDGDIVREEVLGNLILNAIRHTPEGGRIEVSLDGDQRSIHFVVADSGPGIPKEHRAHIFRKYYVADRTRAMGSGLGLAIAKEMAELHGGLILLEDSGPGGGARFRVALPTGGGGPDMEVPDRSLIGDGEPGRTLHVA